MIANKHRVPWAGWVLLGVLGANVSAGGDAPPVNAALKQVTKALKDVRGVVADAEFAEVVENRPIHGTGKLYVDFRGYMRAEIGGDEPRTILFRPPDLYVYRPASRSVEIDDVTTNPDRLAQYLAVGFNPAGTAMKKRYDVHLVGDASLEERSVLEFVLTPLVTKAKEAAQAIARIELSVDPATGFPVRQRIVHSSGLVELDASVRNVTRDEKLPDSLFQPNWPEGTKVIRK